MSYYYSINNCNLPWITNTYFSFKIALILGIGDKNICNVYFNAYFILGKRQKKKDKEKTLCDTEQKSKSLDVKRG